MDSNASQTADADLAMAVAAGDRKALAAIFDRYAPRLLAFAQSMLHNRADAEDCLQDIFILTATRISGLREPDRLRSWLFSIARHECLRRLDRRTREVLVDAVPDDNRSDRSRPAAESPTGVILDNELAALLADATAGLADRDRLVLDLADRQGLTTDEVAAALAMSSGSAYKLLTRARVTARKSIGALLVARTGRENCPELNTLLGNWNGSLTPLLRKRVARHIEECSLCQEQEKRVASPAVLLGAGTAFAMPIPIGLRSNILDTAYEAQTRSMVVPPPDPWAGGWPPKSPDSPGGNTFSGSGSGGAGGIRSGRRGPALAVAAAVAVLLIIGAFVAIGRPSVSPEAVRGPLPLISASSQGVSTPAPGVSSSSPAISSSGVATVSTTTTPSAVAPVVSSAASSRSTPTTRKSPSTPPRSTGSTFAAPMTSSVPPTTPSNRSNESTSSEPSAPPTSRSVVTTPRTSTSTPVTTSKSPTSRTSTTSRPTTPTTRTTTSRTTPTTTSRIDTAPHITGMSVVCQLSKSSGQTVPVLTWSTVNTKVVDLSIDNPGVVGSYGSGYPPNGQLELPPNGCDPSQGTQVYTLYAIGSSGPMDQQTINWVPPPPG